MNAPLRLVAAAALSVLAGCASVVNGPTQSIGIASDPSGATVLIDGAEVGTTPLVAELERERTHRVSLTAPGREPRELVLTRSVSPWVFGNALFGVAGLIGVGVDAGTGGLYRLSPPAIDARLFPRDAGPRLDGPGAVQRPTPTPDIDALARRDVPPSDPLPASAAEAPPGRRSGLYAGAALTITSLVPLPLPTVDLGYERDRFGARLRLPIVLVGRFALEASYAIDTARRTRVYAVGGMDAIIFSGYRFAGIGMERVLDVRRGWFVQLDATLGDWDGGYHDGRRDRDGREAALALSLGVRRR